MITNEPVRGRTPPPWYTSLSGIERVRAFSRGQLPWPPMCRLLGMRTTHVTAGSATVAMPASDACIAGNGQLEITPLSVAALEGATTTALPAGFDFTPLRFTFDPFRPAWPRPGNLIARAHVVNSSDLYVVAEAQVEDADGRHIGRCSLHSEIFRVDPPPPPPPSTMAAVDEPVYATPDPYLRSFASSPFTEILSREDGVALLHKATDGTYSMPVGSLYGQRLEAAEMGHVVSSMPASEWFCGLGHGVSCQAMAAFGSMAGFAVTVSLHRPGTSIVVLDGGTRFFRPVRADGRRLRADATAVEMAQDKFVANAEIYDADGLLVALFTGSCLRIDAARRAQRRQVESRRVLATLLFTDIVDSTGHAERLGDTAWHALLEQHKLAVRREVSRHNGTEVNTTGDGFFVRFDSPAQAIQAARAARSATASLGTKIRAGIHTGECEIEGDMLAGMAVHIAARIQGAAVPGEILVSSTVKDLAVGSNVRFADRGERELKGVPDSWRIFAVTD